MSHKHNIYHGKFINTEKNKLIPANSAEESKYKIFKQSLEPNQLVDIFMEANVDNGTIPQLAKIHVCIRELAKELGYSFEDMKLEVKRQAGLCVKKELNGELFMVCKSFATCSKDELALTIEAIIQIGDTVGINFR
jgi:hypothetical protein